MRHGVFARLSLMLGTLLCLAVAAMGYLLMREAEQRFDQSLLRQTKALVHSLAEGSLDALVTRDYELLERWVAAVVPSERYAFASLARADGLILSHSDPVQVGRQGTPAGPIDSFTVRAGEYARRPVLEVIYPARVRDKLLANATVAYFTDTKLLDLGTALDRIGAIVLGFLAALVLGTMLVLRRELHPLRQLTLSISGASFSAPAELGSPLLGRADEIGALARAFGQLQARLTAAYGELLHEEQRLKAAVEQRTQELQIANQELEAFSYSVSHDLRAPLRAIHGFSAALAEDCGEQINEQCTGHLRRIQSACEKMGHLIDDLLQLSRITRTKLNVAPVDICALARQVIDGLRSGDIERSVDVVIAPTCQVQGDARLLAITLENLLGNAWKFTRDQPQARIEFGQKEIGNETVNFVRDNGAGFNIAYADKLFKAFQRLHTDQQFEGTGIGLSIVQRIVQRHGGRIWAEAEEGKGATFYFTLTGADLAQKTAVVVSHL